MSKGQKDNAEKLSFIDKFTILAGFILFFAERRYKKNSKKQAKE